MTPDYYGPVPGRCRSGYRKHKTKKICIKKSIPKTPTPEQYGPVPGRCRAGYRKHKVTKMCKKNLLSKTKKLMKNNKNIKKDIPMTNVYIASMNMRGKWAKAPDRCKKINVTSSQAKASMYRILFSPMTPLSDGYKGFCCFENYWQAGKRYKGIEDIDKQMTWWKSQQKGKRRYPPGKGKKIMYAEYPGFGPLDYIPSRKRVYVPEYYNLMIQRDKSTKIVEDLHKRALKGECLVFYDFDGPRNPDKTPSIEKISLELLQEKLNDPRFPFGHGYIVAATVAGYKPEDYLN